MYSALPSETAWMPSCGVSATVKATCTREARILATAKLIIWRMDENAFWKNVERP